MSSSCKRPAAARRSRPVADPQFAGRLAELFKALSDQTRVRIISRLADGEVCVHDLAGELDLQQSAVSHQLRLLRHLRIVKNRKNGRHVYYQLDDDHVRDLFDRACEHLSHD